MEVGRQNSEETEDLQDQEDELKALSSILPEKSFFVLQNTKSGFLEIQLDVPQPFYVGENSLESSKSPIKFLPPVKLHFTFPMNYPSSVLPNYVLSSTWLDRAMLTRLCKSLDDRWESYKCAILFEWYSYLKENALKLLGIQDYFDVAYINRRTLNYQKDRLRSKKQNHESTVDRDVKRRKDVSRSSWGSSSGTESKDLDRRAVFENASTKLSLLNYLIEENRKLEMEEFNESFFNCDICLSNKLGIECFKFAQCGHVFCKICINGYFTTLIKGSDARNVRCPGCNELPDPNEVKKNVDPKIYEIYDAYLLKRALEDMNDYVDCPRTNCGSPSFVDCDDSKLATCTRCSYSFCIKCKMGYHGVEPCKLRSGDRNMIYDMYNNGTTEQKTELEKRYGKKMLNSLVQGIRSEMWIEKESKACPHCNSPIQKFDGCNKVTCLKCGTYFCWLCLKQLDKGDPYSHFNDPESKCNNALFLNTYHESDEDEFFDDWDSEESDNDFYY